MTEKKFIEMGDQISKWESEVESIKSKVESEMAAATRKRVSTTRPVTSFKK